MRVTHVCGTLGAVPLSGNFIRIEIRAEFYGIGLIVLLHPAKLELYEAGGLGQGQQHIGGCADQENRFYEAKAA